MKPSVKKNTNPAFKRLQTLPLLSNLPVRLVGVKHYAAAPAVIIVASRPEAGAEMKPSGI